jgi:inosose dehydratase
MEGVSSDRRRFLGKLLAGSAGCASSWLRAADRNHLPNPVGYATIAWPQAQFSAALETISSLGFRGVQLLGWVRDAYAGEKTAQLKERLRSLKLMPVALSCSGVGMYPEREGNEVSEVRAYAAFFQRLGGHYLQVTDAGSPSKAYTAQAIEALGARMNALGKLAQDSGLTLGYHPHFGTIGETRAGLGKLLKATDPRYVKLIADVAHLAMGGADPAEVVRTYHERLIFTHFKDVRRDVAEQARKDRDLARRMRYHFCEIGSGVVDFAAIIRAFRDVQFRGWVMVELDSNEPGPGGPAASASLNKKELEKLGFIV